MSRMFSRIAAMCSLLAVAGTMSPAWGQICCYDPCCCCAPPPPVQCFQQVAVTEFRKVRQTVQRPVIETKYIDQPCTEYRTVMENRTVQVPTCTYQPVTEYRTVQRDCGQWVTNYRCRPEVSPCQYDNRPDLFGFLNRTGYSVRMAFTPRVWAERTYVPNVVCQQIPVTRHVAVQGTRAVNYQAARVVPITTTRKVAVNTVRMVAQEVVINQPVTVMKTVPMGTGLAFGSPWGAGYAYGAPTPLPQQALAPPPQPVSPRSAALPNDAVRVTPRTESAPPARVPNPIGDEDDVFDPKKKGTSEATPAAAKPESELGNPAALAEDSLRIETRRVPQGMFVAHPPTVRAAHRPVGRWVARKKPAVQPQLAGPLLPVETLITSNTRSSLQP